MDFLWYTRYALRDDHWERIECLLSGHEEPVGSTEKDNWKFVEAVVSRYHAGYCGGIYKNGSEIFGSSTPAIYARVNAVSEAGI